MKSFKISKILDSTVKIKNIISKNLFKLFQNSTNIFLDSFQAVLRLFQTFTEQISPNFQKKKLITYFGEFLISHDFQFFKRLIKIFWFLLKILSTRSNCFTIFGKILEITFLIRIDKLFCCFLSLCKTFTNSTSLPICLILKKKNPRGAKRFVYTQQLSEWTNVIWLGPDITLKPENLFSSYPSTKTPEKKLINNNKLGTLQTWGVFLNVGQKKLQINFHQILKAF